MAEALQRAELLRPEALAEQGLQTLCHAGKLCSVLLNEAILHDACLRTCRWPHMSTLWQETARHSTLARLLLLLLAAAAAAAELVGHVCLLLCSL